MCKVLWWALHHWLLQNMFLFLTDKETDTFKKFHYHHFTNIFTLFFRQEFRLQWLPWNRVMFNMGLYIDGALMWTDATCQTVGMLHMNTKSDVMLGHCASILRSVLCFLLQWGCITGIWQWEHCAYASIQPACVKYQMDLCMVQKVCGRFIIYSIQVQF